MLCVVSLVCCLYLDYVPYTIQAAVRTTHWAPFHVPVSLSCLHCNSQSACAPDAGMSHMMFKRQTDGDDEALTVPISHQALIFKHRLNRACASTL